MGGGETRIYSRNGAPIGLIAAGGSIVAAPVRKVEQILRHFSNFSRDGKLRSQRVHCIQIMDDCRTACARQGQTECTSNNKGIERKRGVLGKRVEGRVAVGGSR